MHSEPICLLSSSLPCVNLLALGTALCTRRMSPQKSCSPSGGCQARTPWIAETIKLKHGGVFCRTLEQMSLSQAITMKA